MKNAGLRSMKRGILEYSGIKPVHITSFSSVKTSDETKRKSWISKVEKLGQKLQ